MFVQQASNSYSQINECNARELSAYGIWLRRLRV